MIIKRKKINFQDERGLIIDVVENTPFEHATIIYTKKGAMRGNHYHKESIQYLFVIKGKIRAFTQKVGEDEVRIDFLEENDLIVHEPLEAHAYIAEEDTIFLVLIKGIRSGTQFEKDTYRLAKPLQDLINLK
jgi:dTDP-4-dehydrorhamnose 3,5-epimerase-like enzyme